MKRALLVLLILASTLGTISLILRAVTASRGTIDAQSMAVCHQMAIENEATYARTEFRFMNFYQSCLDNIRYTSPLFRK